MSDFSDLDKLIDSLKYINYMNGRTQPLNVQLGSAGQALQPSLKDRLRSTEEEALNRAAMEQAMRGSPIEDERVQGAILEYLRENILKEFGK